MASSSTRRDIPEAEAERQVFDSLERLDQLRLEELKLVSEEQGWKMEVLRAEMERLEATLTADHPRLIRMKAQLEHYALGREAIGILIAGNDENDEPVTGESWELRGIVKYQRVASPAGLKVVLDAEDRNLESLQAECNADGFYQFTLSADAMRPYAGIPMVLKVYSKAGRVIYTAEKPVSITAGKQTQNINI
jgi:hypothetical protein